jgi:hypothetical protein
LICFYAAFQPVFSALQSLGCAQRTGKSDVETSDVHLKKSLGFGLIP